SNSTNHARNLLNSSGDRLRIRFSSSSSSLIGGFYARGFLSANAHVFRAACTPQQAEGVGQHYYLERGDGLHLDQELLLHEAIDDQERVRRVLAVGKHLRVVGLAPAVERGDVLRVDEERGELDDVLPAG